MKLKLSFLFVFISIYSWSQSSSTQTFNANGTFTVPAGVTTLSIQAWGGGGAGGGAAGAGLLFGRGAAGGGGGAYANAPISVTPSSVLNVIVAGQTSGTTGANGAAGGNSTITGFETSILAAGGSGGAANLGTTPAGANGGSVAASAGSIRLAGGNGGAGSSSLISLLLSSGAGGAGGNAGGLGGASISSLLLGNGPGNAGTAPGGAGSGTINSANGASQVGGAGGAGRVIITYTCSSFSLTSTAASGVCAGSSATSTVSLTGSASSLPVGNYVVTYNRSNPSATALTANLTVTTAGTGSFTAVGLTNVGSSTLTVTNLTSASCNSNITTNNTAIVTISPAATAGTVTGGTTICSGNTSGVLTLSGNVGSVVKWQYAVSPFTIWTDVPNPSTTNTYTSTALTVTTQFRAVVGGGSCSTVNSGTTTVSVITPSIQLVNSSASICVDIDAQNAYIYYSAPQSPITTYSIVWNSSPANTFTDYINTPFPDEDDPIKIFVPAGTSAGTYTGTLTVKNANGCESSGTVITIIVSPAPSIVIESVRGILCIGSTDSEVIYFDYIEPQGDPVTYSIDWDSTVFAAVNNQALPDAGGPLPIIIPAGARAGIYTGTVTVKNVGGCVSPEIVITVTVYTAPELNNDPVLTACPNDEYATSTVALSSNTAITTYAILWDSDSLEAQGDTPFNLNLDNVIVPADLSAGTYTGRIYFETGNCSGNRPITLNITACPPPIEFKSAQNNVSVHSLNKVLNVDSSQGNINQVFVYDISGNLIYKKEGVSDSKLRINNLQSSNQVLVVKVVLDNKKVETKKVFY